MDVTVRGRRDRVDGEDRAWIERKLERLTRLDARIDRVDVEVTFEPKGRIGGGHRVEASCRSGRTTYRASATGRDVHAAVDGLLERLERQIGDHHRRKRNRSNGHSQPGTIRPEPSKEGS